MNARPGGELAGTGALVRLGLRRDRVLLPAWVLGLAGVATFSAAATEDLYPDAGALASAAETLNATAALVALYGKVYDPTSLGAISLIKLTAFGATMVAVVFVFLAARHTRADEETGRLELVGAGVVGRAAPLTAALVIGAIGAGSLGVLTAVGLWAVGLPAAGAVVFGLGWALAGVVFTAATAVVAQLTTSARTTVGIGLGLAGLAYALRAVGDLTAGDPGWLSWLSPIGWSQQLRPFAGDRWWLVVLPLAATALLVPAAFWLRSRRDLGAGLLPDRAGPARGSMGSAVSLAWRLQRGMLVAWLVAVVLLGAVMGSIVENVSGLLDSEQMREYVAALGGQQALVAAFLAAEVGIFGVIVAAYPVGALGRLGSEEATGRADLLLASGTTRLRWAGGQILIAVAGLALLLMAAGAAIGLAYGVTVGEPGGQALRVAGAAAAQLPAALVMAGLAVLVFGAVPRAMPAVWGVLVAFVVLGEFGALWNVPSWVLDLSPFAHSPKLPGGEVGALGLVLLTGVAVACAAVGLLAWRRRDLRA